MQPINRFKLVSIAIMFFVYVIVFYKKLLFDGLIPFTGDTVRFYYPSWVIGKKMLADGWFFLWDSYRGMGQPFSANPSTQGFYPFRLISVFVGFLNYMRLAVVFHVFVSCFFGYLLMYAIFQEQTTAVLGALGMGFNGFFTCRLGYMADYFSIAWVPATLYFLIKKNSIGLGFSLALQWLAGFPPVSILSIFFLMFISIIFRNPLTLGKGLLLMIGLIAFQFIPFIELLKLSSRPLLLDSGEVLAHSITPYAIFKNLVFPSLIFQKNSWDIVPLETFYLGPILFGLFIWGTLRSFHYEKRIFSMAMFGCFALFLSFGKWIPFYSMIPGIKVFRFPSNWAFLFIFAAIIVGCYGLSALKEKKWRMLIITLAAMDLLAASGKINTRLAGETFFTEARNRLAAFMKAPDPSWRIFHVPKIANESPNWSWNSLDWEILKGILTPSYGTSLGYKEVISHNNLITKRNLIYVTRMMSSGIKSPLFDYAGVRMIVTMTKEGNRKNSPEKEDFGVIENLDPKPRFFSPDKLTTRKIFLDQPGNIQVGVDGPGHLVISESFYPGWVVTVDQKPAKITLFENYFLSTWIPAGPHDVRFCFQPTSFKIGLFITCLTLLMVFGWLLLKHHKMKPILWSNL